MQRQQGSVFCARAIEGGESAGSCLWRIAHFCSEECLCSVLLHRECRLGVDGLDGLADLYQLQDLELTLPSSQAYEGRAHTAIADMLQQVLDTVSEGRRTVPLRFTLWSRDTSYSLQVPSFALEA